jgi:hypothetical protein
LKLSIANTVLVFVVVPLAIIVVITGLSLAGGSRRRAKRYRPGRPYDFAPIWFLSSPDQVGSPDPVLQPQGSSAVAGSGRTAAIESGEVQVRPNPVPQGATGGASDRW